VSGTVVPNGHDEDHATPKRFRHLLEATTDPKFIFVACFFLLCCAEVGGDRIEVVPTNIKLWGLDHLPTLDVFSANLDEITSVSIVASDELCNYREWLGGINSEA